jgi:hypothetical protein
MTVQWDAIVAEVERSLPATWRMLDRGDALAVWTNDHVVDSFGTNIVVQQFEESFSSIVSGGISSVELGQSSIAGVLHELLTVGRNSHSGASVTRYMAWLAAADGCTVRIVASVGTRSFGLLAPVVESVATSIRRMAEVSDEPE